MAEISTKTSVILEQQIPDFIREDHDNFVQFLKSYYEFLELTDTPTKIPLVLENPDPQIYSSTNPYGAGDYIIGETIYQKASPIYSDEITASAKVFSLSNSDTSKTIIAISFGGTQKTFIKNYEIVGEKSGAKFYPSIEIEAPRAGTERASLDLRATKNIDETLDDYIQYIKAEFALDLPRALHSSSDTRIVLKNISDFYKSRGTENSFKFLFRLLYGEDMSIYLPETDMLRASDANWKDVTILRTLIPEFDNNYPSVMVKTINLVGRKIKGLTSEASAYVESAKETIYSGFKFAELTLSHRLGNFSIGEFIQTDNVGDGTTIKVKTLGLFNNINIVDGGSNYAVGDRISVSGGSGTGAVAEVATVNSSSGSITSVNILEPGYNYTGVPALDITAPHNAEAGASRFEAGPLETIYYNDFSQYTDANSFFAESDNRGARSNVGVTVNRQVGPPHYMGLKNPAQATANHVGNFITVPGVDEGLKGYWKMNSYYPKDVSISTADGTLGDSNDPVADNSFRGPRVGDITFIADKAHASMQQTQLEYINYSYSSDLEVGDRTGANTYSSAGWTGFQPVVFDESGYGHHARVASWRGTTPNYVSAAYSTFGAPASNYIPDKPDGASALDANTTLYPISEKNAYYHRLQQGIWIGPIPDDGSGGVWSGLSTVSATGNVSIDTTHSKFGSASIRHRIPEDHTNYSAFTLYGYPQTGTLSVKTEEELDAAKGYTIPKGKKWIFSYWTYTDSDYWDTGAAPFNNQELQINLRNSDTPTANIGWVRYARAIITAKNTWEKQTAILDLTHDVVLPYPGYVATTLHGTGRASFTHHGSFHTREGLATDPAGTPLKYLDVDTIYPVIQVGTGEAAGFVTNKHAGNTIWYDGFSLQEYDEFRPTINPNSDLAFANAGIFGAGSGKNSIGTFGEGGLVVMPHDDIRSANTQSWVFWFNPSAKPTGEGPSMDDGAEIIISRDKKVHWSLAVNSYSSAGITTPGDYIDTLFTFNGAKFDNGSYVIDQKIANVSGYYPGGAGGYSEGGTLRGDIWNMLALTIDYTNLVANVYFFNTTDGLLVSNGFTLDSRYDTNTSARRVNYFSRGYSLFDMPQNQLHESEGTYASPPGDGTGGTNFAEVMNPVLPTSPTLLTRPYAFLHFGDRGGQDVGETEGSTVGHITWNKSDGIFGHTSLEVNAINVTGRGGWNFIEFSPRYQRRSTSGGYDAGDVNAATQSVPHAIKIPKGKKWIYSFYAKANNVYAGGEVCDVRVRVGFGNTTHQAFAGYLPGSDEGEHTNPQASAQITEANTWKRYSWIFDLRSTSVQGVQPDGSGAGTGGGDQSLDQAAGISIGSDLKEMIYVYPKIGFFSRAATQNAYKYHFTALQWEEATDSQTEPTAYEAPLSDWSYKRLSSPDIDYNDFSQGRAIKLGEKSESANGDMFLTEGDQKVHGNFDEVRYYDKALSWPQLEALFYNPGGRFDKVLSGDWVTPSWGGTGRSVWYSAGDPTTVEFRNEIYEYGNDLEVDGSGRAIAGEQESERISYAGGSYISLGNMSGQDQIAMTTNKNIPFDPTIRYKMSVRAKDGSDSQTSNASIGVMGLSNTGIELIARNPENYQSTIYGIYQFVMSRSEETPAYSSSLGPGWFTYTGVYGGNTAPEVNALTSGWKANPGAQYSHGGNTIQLGTGEGSGKSFYNWANPAKLHGSISAATQQGTGNTAFVRPVIWVNQHNTPDQTFLDFVKIEQQKDATLTAEIGAEFKYPGEFLDDSGKIGTSPQNTWITKYLQDDKYYQVFSYVVKSGLSIGSYKEVVKKLVHPAGLILYGLVDIQTLISVRMAAFAETFSGEILDIFKAFYMGAESSLLSDYADVPLGGIGVTYKTQFGLKGIAQGAFNLNLTHGMNPHGGGKNLSGSPGWIAWDESPLESPFANSHYYGGVSGASLWPYAADMYPTSNAYTTVTSKSLIWHIKGNRTLLVSAFQNANYGSRLGQAEVSRPVGHDVYGVGQRGWYNQVAGIGAGTFGNDSTKDDLNFTQPLDIDGGEYRYVRMKVRRIGPGGNNSIYDVSSPGSANVSWLGACQADTNPSSYGSTYPPTLWYPPAGYNAENKGMTGHAETGFMSSYHSIAANTIDQPSTLIIPADASLDAKSPWHILEWDMWNLGVLEYNKGGGDYDIYPTNGGTEMWKWANSSTGTSVQDGGDPSSARRIGSLAFHLCYEPDNKPVGEKFEIEWIQVDNGTGWPRGSYALPAGYISNTSEGVASTGAGVGGVGSYNRMRVSESSDMTNQTIGDFSVAVSPAATAPSEIVRGAPVLYTHSDKNIINPSSPASNDMNDRIYSANGAIFRVSANTANNLDWVVTEVIDSEKLLRSIKPSNEGGYIGPDLSANGKFSGPVILDTDVNDNLYVGYLYEHFDAGTPSYPGLNEKQDPKPLMLFRLTPTDNVQTDITESSDPHNLRSVGSTSPPRGRSNTYSVEPILWGNVGGVDGVGVMIGDARLYAAPHEPAGTIIESGGHSGHLVDFSTDDLGSLYIVGSGSQNVIKILPGANGSYANGFTRYDTEIGQLPGRTAYELATTESFDANGNVLGNWRPTNSILGPKDSLFVSCDTGYDPTNRGANSVYCYHVVTSHNVATGEVYTQNIYPVFANVGGQTASAVGTGPGGGPFYSADGQPGLMQSCAGLVLDHEDPPNLYYMSANNMYRIQPKGYSYQIGDTTIEQVFPEDYFHNTLKMLITNVGVLGFYGSGRPSATGINTSYQNNYQQLQIDRRGRIYFGGRANLYCYSRNSNTSEIKFNESNTEFSTLQVVANTSMYTDNVAWSYGPDVLETATIESFVLGASTGNSAYTISGGNNFSEGVYITMHTGETIAGSGPGSFTNVNGRRLIVVYPNANGSFVTEGEGEGGQLALTIMDENPADETKYETDGTGGENKYRGSGRGKVVLRPEKV